MHPLRALRATKRWPPPGTLYWRLTLGFTLGLYLPWAATAPDLARHFGEALHSWAAVFLAPLAAWRLLIGALGRTGTRTAFADPHLSTRSPTKRCAMQRDG